MVLISDSFVPLLDAELKAEIVLINERLSQWDARRLVREGYCFRSLNGFISKKNFTTSKKQGDIVIFTPPPGESFGESKIE